MYKNYGVQDEEKVYSGMTTDLLLSRLLINVLLHVVEVCSMHS